MAGFFIGSDGVNFIAAPKCKSENNKHILDDCSSPFVAKCVICGERFVLVAETVLEKLGIDVTPRQVWRS